MADLTDINEAVGKLADIEFTPRKIDQNEPEPNMITGMITGYCDTWGKWTVAIPQRDKRYYLFADEIDAITIMDIEEITKMAMGRAI